MVIALLEETQKAGANVLAGAWWLTLARSIARLARLR
jgi:hypothetical protein